MRRLTFDTLESQLQSGQLLRCYLLVGSETFLLQEAKRLIWEAAKQQGFQKGRLWEITNSFEWDQLTFHQNHYDLFHTRCFDELRCSLPSLEPVSKQLTAYITNLSKQPSFTQISIIHCAQPTHLLQKGKGFQQLSQLATVISLDPPSPTQFSRWLVKRLQKIHLTLTTEALSYLEKWTENNLLAAAQVIEKLQLIYEAANTPITLEQVQPILEDQAQFELFTLTESALQGRGERCIRILHYLEETHVAPALILGYLLKTTRLLIALCQGIERQQPLSELFQQQRIWPKQQPLFRQAMQRFGSQELQVLFHLAHQIDRYIKGVEKGPVWNNLQRFALQLSGVGKLTL